MAVKSRIAAIVGAVLGLALGAGRADAQMLELKFGTTNPPGGVQYLSAEEFVKRFNAKMAGKAKMELFHSGQLGSDGEMLQKLKLGTLDLSQPSTATSSVLPEFGLFDMPYLVRDRKHMACIGDKIVWQELAPKYERQGYRLVGIWENGIRQITNNLRPVVTPDDLKGMKLRVPQGTWRIRMFQAYGANPTPMAFSELFIALKTGVMDGQENPYTNVTSGKLNEVQKFVSETNHIYTPSFPTASLRRWNAWPEDVRKAMLEAGQEVQPWTYAVAEKEDENTKRQIVAAGMQFNVANRAAFVKASEPVYEMFAKEVPGGKELVERALKLADGGC